MNDKTFNYSRLNLTIGLLSSNSQEEIESISCTTENLYKENYSLNCFAENEMSGEIESAASDLGKEILVVNFLNTSNNRIDFFSSGINNIFYKKKGKGISKGAIIAIVLSLVLTFILIFAAIMFILYRKEKIEDNKLRAESSIYVFNEPKL